jgi:hypothetical protein
VHLSGLSFCPELPSLCDGVSWCVCEIISSFEMASKTWLLQVKSCDFRFHYTGCLPNPNALPVPPEPHSNPGWGPWCMYDKTLDGDTFFCYWATCEQRKRMCLVLPGDIIPGSRNCSFDGEVAESTAGLCLLGTVIAGYIDHERDRYEEGLHHWNTFEMERGCVPHFFFFLRFTRFWTRLCLRFDTGLHTRMSPWQWKAAI